MRMKSECSKLFPGTDEVMLLETQAVLNGILDDPVHTCPVKNVESTTLQAASANFNWLNSPLMARSIAL